MKENLAMDESSTSIIEIMSTHCHQVKPAIDQLPQCKPIKHKRKKNKGTKGVQEKEDLAVVDQIATTSVDKDVQELAVEPTKVIVCYYNYLFSIYPIELWINLFYFIYRMVMKISVM